MKALHHQINAQDRRLFLETFGKEPHSYWDVHFGFDLIAFEEDFFPNIPDGTSLKDAITEKHGEAVADLIAKLIR